MYAQSYQLKSNLVVEVKCFNNLLNNNFVTALSLAKGKQLLSNVMVKAQYLCDVAIKMNSQV